MRQSIVLSLLYKNILFINYGNHTFLFKNNLERSNNLIRITMKSKIKILIIFLAVSISTLFFTNQVFAQYENVSFQVFYDQLSPYGQWVDYGGYGYVWIPDAGLDFAPYSTNGYWIMTDYGWTWVSDYNWGWAPFHYGRWDYDSYFGWFWVPGNQWGPSWVTWRRSEGYYGWEPMRPGVTVNGSFASGYNSRSDHWIFVKYGDINRSNISRYSVNRSEHDRIIQNSTVINITYVDSKRHTTYVSGPAREEVQKNTGRNFNPVSVQENNKPGQEISGGQLRIYRPLVSNNYNNEKKPAPSKITDRKDVKRSPENNTDKNSNNKKEQPTNNVKPANNNNTQPVQQHKSNPPDNNRQDQPVNNAKPANNTQPAQQHKSNPPDNNRQDQPANNAKPANNNNNTQPVQQHKSNPPDNNKQDQPANTAKPMNNNNTQPAQENKSTQPNNNKQQQPQNNAKPVHNNNNAQPAQQHKSNPPENKKQEQPANNVKQENNNNNGHSNESK
jgi:hypothetical protein